MYFKEEISVGNPLNAYCILSNHFIFISVLLFKNYVMLYIIYLSEGDASLFGCITH